MFNLEDIVPMFFLNMAGFVVLGLYLVQAFAYYKMAEKAQVKNAWLSFIPFLQFVIFFHLINKSAWNIFLLIIPLVNIVLMLVWTYRLFEVFDAGGPVGMLVIVLSLFFGITLMVYEVYLAFSPKVVYVGEHRFH